MGGFFQDLFLWFVTSLPWLVPLAAVIVLIAWLVRRSVKSRPERAAKRAARRAAKAEKKAQRAAAKTAAPAEDTVKNDEK